MREVQDNWPAGGYADWIGRRQEASDALTPGLVERFIATIPLPGKELFDGSSLADFRAGPADQLPLCLHWCLAPIAEPKGRLGPDGHPAMGVYLPPITGMRRMWAGGALTFYNRMRIGDDVHRTTTMRSITRKQGRSGALVFIELDHVFETARGTCVTERQDLVYRPAHGKLPKQAATDEPAPLSTIPTLTIATEPVLLFRYSALTFNGHRIHYDEPYARDVEGYRGLVVHGPLIATLLANLADMHMGGITAFNFRARAPLFCGEELALYVGETESGCDLQARGGGNGRLIMTAIASSA